jgi:phosphoenolpyruvate phosphomutase
MLDLRGRPLLRRLTQSFNDCGIRDITVVAGYKSDAIDLSNIRKVVNKDYATTGEIASLAEALDALNGDCVVSYGDIVFRRHILELLLQSEGDIAVVVDAQPQRNEQGPIKHNADLVLCSSPPISDVLDDRPVALEKVSSDLAHGEIHGEWIGLMKLSGRGAELLRKEIEAMQADGSAAKGDLPQLLNRLIGKGEKPSVVYITGQWLDVNDAFDLAKARNFT